MSDINRKSNSIRIANILESLNDPIKLNFEQNVSLFSNKELFMILEFLESGKLNPIGKILDIKIEEYKDFDSDKNNKTFLGKYVPSEYSSIFKNFENNDSVSINEKGEVDIKKGVEIKLTGSGKIIMGDDGKILFVSGFGYNLELKDRKLGSPDMLEKIDTLLFLENTGLSLLGKDSLEKHFFKKIGKKEQGLNINVEDGLEIKERIKLISYMEELGMMDKGAGIPSKATKIYNGGNHTLKYNSLSFFNGGEFQEETFKKEFKKIS